MRGKPKDGSKNPGGRPLEWTEDLVDSLGESLIAWSQQHTSCYLETFCSQNHTYPQKLSEFSARNKKFAEALKTAKASCASHLAEATAGGEMPPAFGIFALKQHGWTDKHEVTGEGGGPLTMAIRISFTNPEPTDAP